MNRYLYRPHRAGLNESLKDMKVFENLDDMAEYIVASNALKIPVEDRPGAYEWLYPFRKEELFWTDKTFYDTKADWENCKYIKTKRYFNEFSREGMIVGHFCEYEYNLKADLLYLIQKYCKRRR